MLRTRARHAACTCSRLSTSASRLARRSLSSTSTSSPQPRPSQPALLLRDLRQLLGQYPLLDEAWNSRLERAVADLERARKARIAVVGDQQSGATELVSALLDDPLASDADVTVALEARRLGKDTPEAMVISYSEESNATSSEVKVPSAWLREIKAEIVEVQHGDVPPLESSFSSLHLSDIVVLVLSDSSLLSSMPAQTVLYNLHQKPNLLVALNCPDATPSASASPLRTLEHQLKTLFPTDEEPRTIVISTKQALAGLEALQPSEPDQPPSYDDFQHNYLASQIPHIHQLLTTAITSSSSATVPTPLQIQTAAYVLSAALHRAAFAGAQIADSLASASSSLSALSQQTDEHCASLRTSLGVEPTTGLMCVPKDELAGAAKALDELFLTRLAWYKLPYRVDDLAAEIALVVERTYLPRFEDSLVFASGKALSLASVLGEKTDKVLSSPLFSLSPASEALSPSAKLASLYSPTLLNVIDQASRDASTALSSTPTSLSSAVTHRRNQITSPGGPVEALQRRAQKSIIQSSTLALSSAGLAVASELTAFAELGTNFGAGLLGVTISCWWLQRGWEKAKKRFRKDVFERITGGVEEDLGVRAARLTERAAFKARTTVAMAGEVVKRKQGEWEKVRRQLAEIERRRKEMEGAKVAPERTQGKKAARA
ncbi:hypothetical protein RTG_00076 [Rhodotorula toruloides ATCC 204091]|uniref:Mmc1 C-terminal domain-containing protein n=1 Tax=Rhodotorula toruloides TaxID=5286 RepID=A0A0K3CCG0_RHOTO|nr:hypothetical protein RTG_00076 [Rhodotorula toruloides ATCC 204091]KAK4334958.1 hypothetical protein RTBOTA2_003700 [Rhodotorula toruloides]PRQ76357.1 hypothetical protein AAT19DRAFT_13379 [Rhodotorula toruloides]